MGGVLNRLAVSAYAGWMALLWAGLVAGELGIFLLWRQLAVALVVATGCYVALKIAPSRLSLSSWIAASVAVVAMIAAWPPGHVMQMQWDPAIYIQSGAVLAREGGLAFDLSVFRALPEVIQQLVSAGGWHEVPYAGIVVNEGGRAVPVFFHLFPVWVASCFSVGGLDAALAVNIPLYGMAIVAMYALACRWFGPGWGVFAAVLLALFPAEIWQSRFPTSELLAQVLLLGGWFFLDVALRDEQPGRLAGWMSGVSFGLAMMTRFDSLLVVAPLLVLLSALWFDRTRRATMGWVMMPLVLLTIHAFAHSVLMGSPYFPRRTWVIAGLVMVGLVWLLQWVIAWVRRTEQVWWMNMPRRAMVVVAAAWLAWLAFSWWVRPLLVLSSPSIAWWPDLPAMVTRSLVYRVVSGADAWNMTILANLGGSPLLLAGLIGVVVMLARRTPRGSEAGWALMAMSVWAVLVFSLHHERQMMWLSRRFIPVVIPSLIIGVAALGYAINQSARLRDPAKRFSLVLLVLLVGAGLREPIGRVGSIREFYGTKNGFVSLAQKMDKASLIFADHTGVGAVLRTVYGFDAFELHAPTMERREVLMQWLPALNAARPIVFITPIPVSHEQEMHYVMRGHNRFSARIYEQPNTTIPERFVDITSEFYIYDVVPYPAEGTAP
jgi:hypothetical protein